MPSNAHYKWILAGSSFPHEESRRIIQGFERIPILLKPRNNSQDLPLKLLPIAEKLDGKRIRRPWFGPIFAFLVGILSKVQS